MVHMIAEGQRARVRRYTLTGAGNRPRFSFSLRYHKIALGVRVLQARLAFIAVLLFVDIIGLVSRSFSFRFYTDGLFSLGN